MNKRMEEMQSYCDIIMEQDLKKITTFRIGGFAKYYIQPKNEIALIETIKILNENKIKYTIFGKGSNYLCSDEYFDGAIISLSLHMKDCFFEEDNTVVVQAGASIIYLAHVAMNHSLSGLEFASGIPATVGGAVYMNAGAYKSSMQDIVVSVKVLDTTANEIFWLHMDDLKFSYRHSIFHEKPNYIIMAVKMKLIPGNKEEISELMNKRKERRLASQPLDLPSAGSVFRNVDSLAAWKLIEDSGLRGYRIGGAQISDKHANFIVNVDNAKAKDVDDLITTVQEKVKEKFGVDLVTEVEKFNWKI